MIKVMLSPSHLVVLDVTSRWRKEEIDDHGCLHPTYPFNIVVAGHFYTTWKSTSEWEYGLSTILDVREVKK